LSSLEDFLICFILGWVLSGSRFCKDASDKDITIGLISTEEKLPNSACEIPRSATVSTFFSVFQ